MKIYTIERRGKIGYDEMCSCVVIAEHEEQARFLASLHAGDEGDRCWLDANQTVAKEQGEAYMHAGSVTPSNTQTYLLCRNFNAG